MKLPTSSVKLMHFLTLAGILLSAPLFGFARDESNEQPAATAPRSNVVVPLLNKDLTGIEGKETLMLTVEYPPGWSTAKHRHNAHVFVYVLEGSVVMQNEGGAAAVTLGPGQTFYESPDDIHAVAKNASDTKPAKFLVFIVKEKGAPVLVPVQ